MTDIRVQANHGVKHVPVFLRRRHQMEMAAQQREQEGQRLIRESDSIRKKLK